MGNFGEHLEEAKRTGFFRWFHLEQTATTPQNNHQVISFQPSGPKFRSLVKVKATTEAEGRLRTMELMLARSFIDSPVDGVLARDIAKSFLLTGLADSGEREIVDLINEIQYGGTSTMPVLRHESAKAPPLPEKPTPGYLTYLGKQPSYEHRVPGFLVRLDNRTVEGTTALVCSIQRQ